MEEAHGALEAEEETVTEEADAVQESWEEAAATEAGSQEVRLAFPDQGVGIGVRINVRSLAEPYSEAPPIPELDMETQPAVDISSGFLLGDEASHFVEYDELAEEVELDEPADEEEEEEE